jgi:hypothetical protein
MSQQLIRVSCSLTAIYKIHTLDSEKEQWPKHIEEISRHLDIEPIRSEFPTFEQQEWLEFRMARHFPKPYRPWLKTKKEFKYEYKTFSVAKVLASVEPLKETDG